MLQQSKPIGRFDVRIVIQQAVEATDEYNQKTKPTWGTYATVWAMLEDNGGSEGYQADQLTARRNTVFTIRYLSGLRETMRILYNNRVYDIQYINSPDRKRTLKVGTILLDDPDDSLGGEFSDVEFSNTEFNIG